MYIHVAASFIIDTHTLTYTMTATSLAHAPRVNYTATLWFIPVLGAKPMISHTACTIWCVLYHVARYF